MSQTRDVASLIPTDGNDHKQSDDSINKTIINININRAVNERQFTQQRA